MHKDVIYPRLSLSSWWAQHRSKKKMHCCLICWMFLLFSWKVRKSVFSTYSADWRAPLRDLHGMQAAHSKKKRTCGYGRLMAPYPSVANMSWGVSRYDRRRVYWYFRPLGMFYDSFALISQICIHSDALELCGLRDSKLLSNLHITKVEVLRAELESHQEDSIDQDA